MSETNIEMIEMKAPEVEVKDEIKEEPVKEKKHKTFKDYYADPEYRQKHKKYISEKIKCECGRSVTRVGMAKHLRTRIHLNAINNKVKDEKTETLDLRKILDRLVEDKLIEMLSADPKQWPALGDLKPPKLERQTGYIKNLI